nr:zonadhesin-like protein 1 [Plectrocnemia conspersa]
MAKGVHLIAFLIAFCCITTVTGKCVCLDKCDDPNEILIWVSTGEKTCFGVGPAPSKSIKECRCKDGYVRHEGKCIKPCNCPKCDDPNEIFGLYTTGEKTCFGVGPAPCKPVKECRCKDGYVRHEGKCIKPCNCPKCDDPNEIFGLYTTGEKTCFGVGPAPCKPVKECRCKDGYVRHEGKCIKPCKCPKCDDPNEIFGEYTTGEKTCFGVGPAPCKPVKECRCRDGYVRHEGKCIKPCECPKCDDPNEIFGVYTTGEKTCFGVGPAPCKPVKEDGYVRHEGKCIKPCECPKCDDPNEIFGVYTTGEKTCFGVGPAPCKPVKECRCRDGYVRHEGKCIKPCECPKCDDPNEIFGVYTTGEKTCFGVGPAPCKPVKECRCKDGYVRHEGECIKPCECPKCDDPNEIFGLYTTGEKTCFGVGPAPCKPVKECRCKDGYVRYKGECIKPCECPKCDDPNEIFGVYTTGEKTCFGVGPDPCKPVKECRCRDGYVRHEGKCIKPCECPKCDDPNEIFGVYTTGEKTCFGVGPAPCKPVKECRCKDGYVRHEGECIKPCECPKCDDPNEIFGEYTTGEKTCFGVGPAPCKPVKECRCKDGYVRYKGECIKPCECPKCDDPNEIFGVYTTGEKTCFGVGPDPCKPVKECRCRDGYVRHEGKCIKPCECPKCDDPNEIFGVYTTGEKTCFGVGPAPCKPVKECRCKDGYVRHEGKCIKPCECPKCDDPNEIFGEYTTGEKTCFGVGPAPCKPVKECRCKDGYVRYKGECIKPCECPKCDDPNEIFGVYTTGEKTCFGVGPDPCKPVKECRCRDGYVRHEGKCIKPCECPKCDDPNEIFGVYTTGEKTCFGVGPALVKPVKECRCKDGYVRHEGECIKPCECPKCDDPNEIFGVYTTGEKTCFGVGPAPCKPVKECRCKDGYVRHKGECIKPCECPKCDDPNEIFGVYTTGEKTCFGVGPAPCKPVKECRCRDGYVRHEGKCIKPCECPKCDDPNEIFGVYTTGEKTCFGVGPAPCKPVKECRCRDGYVRHEGKCIKPCECPKCDDPNEIFGVYTTGEKTCFGVGPAPCKPVKECRCRDGYVRYEGKCIKPCDCRKYSTILIIKKYTRSVVNFFFLAKCKDPNEEYILATTGEKTCDGQNPAPCKPILECRCKRGYVRCKGRCIKICECRELLVGKLECFKCNY